jgi:phage-related protein
MKPIKFLNKTVEEVRKFPADARREAGLQLFRVQCGQEPDDWKPMPSIGSGVREIRIRVKGQYRVIYIAKFQDAIYVLAAFQKKSQKTPKNMIAVAKRALKLIVKL